MGQTISGIFRRVLNQPFRDQFHPCDCPLHEEPRDKHPPPGDINEGSPIAYIIMWRGTSSKNFGGAVPANLASSGLCVLGCEADGLRGRKRPGRCSLPLVQTGMVKTHDTRLGTEGLHRTFV